MSDIIAVDVEEGVDREFRHPTTSDVQFFCDMLYSGASGPFVREGDDRNQPPLDLTYFGLSKPEAHQTLAGFFIKAADLLGVDLADEESLVKFESLVAAAILLGSALALSSVATGFIEVAEYASQEPTQ